MQAQGDSIPAFGEAHEPMRAAPPDRRFEAPRFFACDFAYCDRDQEAFSLPDLKTRIKALRGRR
jgi:hypothetical protein